MPSHVFKAIAFLGIAIGFVSCAQIDSDDRDVRAVPTTNNPNYRQTVSNGFPGMPIGT